MSSNLTAEPKRIYVFKLSELSDKRIGPFLNRRLAKAYVTTQHPTGFDNQDWYYQWLTANQASNNDVLNVPGPICSLWDLN